MDAEITIDAPNLLAQRAVLVPLKPRSQEEAAALPATIAALQSKAAADAHTVIAPSHVMLKGGECIGYLSLGQMPTVQAWFDSHHKHAADSLKMIEMGETILREQGHRVFGICCMENSPFNAHMGRLGFTKLGVTELWVKNL